MVSVTAAAGRETVAPATWVTVKLFVLPLRQSSTAVGVACAVGAGVCAADGVDVVPGWGVGALWFVDVERVGPTVTFCPDPPDVAVIYMLVDIFSVLVCAGREKGKAYQRPVPPMRSIRSTQKAAKSKARRLARTRREAVLHVCSDG